MPDCRKCGECCRLNGLIPPVLEHDTGPDWLLSLVQILREHTTDIAGDRPCMFLTRDNRCAIYNDRPNVCREFDCRRKRDPESEAMQELRRMLEKKEARLDGAPTPDEIAKLAKKERDARGKVE